MDVRSQLDAARRSVLAVPFANRRTLVATGADRVSWLNGMVTCDLVKRADGAAKYGLFVVRNGRVLADAIIALGDDRVLAAVPAGAADALRTHLEHYLVMEDVELDVRADAIGPWELHGPRSGDVLAAARRAGAIGGALDRTGWGGAVIFAPDAPDARATEVRAAIEAAVAGVGGAMGDDIGWDTARLERAVPEFGVDFDANTYPQEAHLEKGAVSFDKGCYLGQEVVCMLELRGQVRRRLAPIVLEGGEVPARSSRVNDVTGAEVGEVTSSVVSPTLGVPIALAMLKRAFAEPGRAVTVDGRPARVVERPA